jgi:hypothetical protein
MELSRMPSATRYRLSFREPDLLAESTLALEIAEDILKASREPKRWINFPLINRNGDASQIELVDYAGAGIATSFQPKMPLVREVLAQFTRWGFDIQYARIAILFDRDVLRPHFDMYQATRFLLPLTEQGHDFRHLFENVCVSMHAGELWGLDGGRCHGAANVSAKGTRVMLLIDTRLRQNGPDWFYEPWEIPPDRIVTRPEWSPVVRDTVFERAARISVESGLEAAEYAVLMGAFEYDISATAIYSELLRFCEQMANGKETPYDAMTWRMYAEGLKKPQLPFQVSAS